MKLTLNGQVVDSLPEGFGERVQLSPEVEQSILKHLADPEYHKFMAGEGMAKAGDVEAAIFTSPAARRAAQIDANRDAPLPAIVKRVDIEGEPEPYWVRTWDQTRINLYEMNTNRVPDGRLDLRDAQKTRSFLAALLYCGVVRGEYDARPYFEFIKTEVSEPMATVWEWVDSTDPAICDIASRLQAEVMLMNPRFFDLQGINDEVKDALKRAGIDIDAPDPREKKESSPQSLMSGSSTPTDGLETTASTTAPPLSPIDSTEAMGSSDTATAISD